jgi:outer membrane protein TolC
MSKLSAAMVNAILLTCQVSSAQTKLDGYIKEGLSSNESIKQQQFVLEKSLYALKESKSLFFPAITFNGTYTLAGGGRLIEFPVGDLLNPAYKTLNQITGSNTFPQIQNRNIQLNPNNFYDIKLHTVYPVINAEIGYNRKIKGQEVDLQTTEINIYKRELAKEIKIAYYNYLQAFDAIKIYENALGLVKENARINTVLFNNEKVNRTVVTRSNNEVIRISAQLNTARENLKNAQAYFNFLLNRVLDSDVEIDSTKTLPSDEILSDTATDKREELAKLSTANAINKNLIQLANAYRIPRLNSFFDLGLQGFDLNVNSKTSYYFFGLSLEWNIFSGQKNKYRIKQAEADQKELSAQTSYVKRQLELQVKVAANSFSEAVVNYNAAVSHVNASERYYKDELRLYKEGTILFIELLDAQNQLVLSQLQSNISLYDAWKKHAEMERANARLVIK